MMNSNIVYKIREELLHLSEEKYRAFQSNLCPGVENILGVRVPLLRKISVNLSKDNYADYLNNEDVKYYEETMIRGLTIGYIKVDNDTRFDYIRNFVPQINNWAICDSFCSNLKFTKKNMNEVWNFLMAYLSSDKEFELRFVIVMMLNYFMTDEYIDDVLNILNDIHHNGYYVKMAVAWALSVAYIHFPNKTLDYLKNNNLDNFTYNKSLQKIIESNRVCKEDKNLIRTMKIK